MTLRPSTPGGDATVYPETPKGAVPAVLRAAQVLEALAEAKEPMTMAELADRLALPRSTVHGLCTTLASTGLASRLPGGAYRLGPRLLHLAQSLLAQSDLTSEFIRTIEALDPMPEESIVLSVLDGQDIVYVACRSGKRPFGLNLRIGMRLPAHCTASGKALLAHLDPASRAGFIRSGELTALTDRSLVEPEALERDLGLVRRRGFAQDMEETRRGILCFGAPVFAAGSEAPVAAVGISMPRSAVDATQRARAIEAVKSVAGSLTERLGGTIPGAD